MNCKKHSGKLNDLRPIQKFSQALEQFSLSPNIMSRAYEKNKSKARDIEEIFTNKHIIKITVWFLFFGNHGQKQKL